jgi:hypothetical protein
VSKQVDVHALKEMLWGHIQESVEDVETVSYSLRTKCHVHPYQLLSIHFLSFDLHIHMMKKESGCLGSS